MYLYKHCYESHIIKYDRQKNYRTRGKNVPLFNYFEVINLKKEIEIDKKILDKG